MIFSHVFPTKPPCEYQLICYRNRSKQHTWALGAESSSQQLGGEGRGPKSHPHMGKSGVSFGGPKNKDYSILGSMLGSPCFGQRPL